MNLKKLHYVFGVLLCAQVALAEIRYTVQVLPAPVGAFSARAEKINDSGLIVGRGFYNTTPYRGSALLWQNGSVSELPLPSGYRSGEAYHLNQAGQIVGIVSLVNIDSPGNRTVRWDNGQPVDVTSSDDGGREAYELGINDFGDVAGHYLRADGSNGGFAVINNVLIDLGLNPSRPNSINNDRIVVGSGTNSAPNANDSATVWSPATGARRLQTISDKTGMFTAHVINQPGQIVGRRVVDSTGATQAYLWTSGHVTDLGTLGGPQSDPLDVNDSGTVVGNADTPELVLPGFPQAGYVKHAFVYEGQLLLDLNTLIDPSLNLTLIEAMGINNHGQIIARTSNQSVLLTPVPEPASAASMAVAITLSLQRRRRN